MVALVVSGGLEARLVVRRGPTWSLDIDLTVPAGQTAALLGPNGAGKSTAVEAIAGLTRVDAPTRIVVNGRILTDDGVAVPSAERRIGVVFQDHLLFPHMTVGQNIGFGPRSSGKGVEQTNAIVEHWLREFDLEELADAAPSRLSGGQAQLVAVARALASDPQVLLLDEPLSALDVTTRRSVRRTLAGHLAAFEGPRVLITHDPNEAFLLADTIHVVEQGRLVQSGTADDLRLRPRSAFAADLAGTNLMRGAATATRVLVAGGELQIADRGDDGPVLVTIHPRAISLFPDRPEGSPRNTWETTIAAIEPMGDRVRVGVGAPIPLVAEITAASASGLHLTVGTRVWVAVKATEIGVETI